MTNLEWIKSLSALEMEELLSDIYTNGQIDGWNDNDNFLWDTSWLEKKFEK